MTLLMKIDVRIAILEEELLAERGETSKTTHRQQIR
jgi:hypothetical protein